MQLEHKTRKILLCGSGEETSEVNNSSDVLERTLLHVLHVILFFHMSSNTFFRSVVMGACAEFLLGRVSGVTRNNITQHSLSLLTFRRAADANGKVNRWWGGRRGGGQD